MKFIRFLSIKLIAAIILCIPFFTFAQSSKERENTSELDQFEMNLLPVNDSVDCYLSFNKPYNRLIFVMDSERFTSGVEIFFDVKLNNKIDQRKYFSKNVSVSSYEETKSKEKMIEGFINFRLANKEYVIYPSLKFANTNQTIILDSISVNIKRAKEFHFLKPIVVEKTNNSCDGTSLFKVVNHNNKIPFAAKNYDLFIPVIDSNISEANVKIEQAGNVLFDDKILVSSTNELSITECDGNIVIKKNGNQEKLFYILIENFNNKLNEGPISIKVYDRPMESSFLLNVEWIDKPISLSNINLSVELLELIYDRSELLDLYKSSNKNKYKALYDFWDNKFPDRKFKFNEWMDEFYKRADYAMENFSNLSNQIGAKTDRGKIYIQYGKPDDIKREYSSTNNIIEIWYYKDLQKEFIFTDRTGLGNYILSK